MRKLHLLGIILSLIPLPVLLYYLNSQKLIDLQLAVTLVIVEVPIGILFHHFTKEKKEGSLDKHSTKISDTITIMSEGRYSDYLDKTEFLIPYPYSEYKQYQRKIDFPTLDETMELFNKPVWSRDERKHDFVPIDKSPEGNFKQAMSHLKSYKKIYPKFQLAKKEQENWHQFVRENYTQIDEIMKKQSKLQDVESDPFYLKYSQVLKKCSETTKSLQISLKILSEQLVDGEKLKGKCELGY